MAAGGRSASIVAACITDWLDGYLARVWRQQSQLGRMLDPIADKLLVGATLLMLTHDNTIDKVHVAAAVIILCREILVSGLREFLAELNVRVHVTQLAKWKTTMQMVALGVLLAGPAGDKIIPGVTWTGLVMLWMAALLTLWTGYDYFSAGAPAHRWSGVSRRQSVKILYFAWVREKTGKAEESVDLPAERQRPWPASSPGSGARRRNTQRPSRNQSVVRAAIDQTHVQAPTSDRRRLRDRVLSARDRRLTA